MNISVQELYGVMLLGVMFGVGIGLILFFLALRFVNRAAPVSHEFAPAARDSHPVLDQIYDYYYRPIADDMSGLDFKRYLNSGYSAQSDDASDGEA